MPLPLESFHYFITLNINVMRSIGEIKMDDNSVCHHNCTNKIWLCKLFHCLSTEIPFFDFSPHWMHSSTVSGVFYMFVCIFPALPLIGAFLLKLDYFYILLLFFFFFINICCCLNIIYIRQRIQRSHQFRSENHFWKSEICISSNN